MANGLAGQNHGKIAMNRNYVPFPTGLTTTQDSKVCAQHAGLAGAFGCSAGLLNGMFALIWDCRNCKVEGYHLFNVSGGDGKPQPVAIPANGAEFTAALLTPTNTDVGCYAVRSFRGANESELSNTYCTGGGSAGIIQVRNDTFHPDQVRSSSATESKTNNGDPSPISYRSETSLEVGATHWTQKLAVGDSSGNTIARAGVHFDLHVLTQKHILSAKLHVTVDTTIFSVGAADHSTSCTSAIDVGKEYWWRYGDWIFTQRQKSAFDTTARLEPGSADGPEAVYDVTPIVVDWAAEGTDKNFGFVLMTDDQGISAFTETGCQTKYTGTPSLEVKYY